MAGVRLSQERYDELILTERMMLEMLPDLDKLEQCGEDCTVEKQAVANKVQQITKIKEHFSPLS